MVKLLKKSCQGFVFFISVLSAAAFGNENVKIFQIATLSSGLPSVVGSLYIEKNFTDVPLLTRGGNNSSLKVLSEYYNLGKLNDLEGLAALSFSSDGSRSWMANEIVGIPDKFSGFKKLEKVVATNYIRWGEYDIYGVDWYVTDNRKVGSWLESVICLSQASCKISNLVLNGSENSSLFSTALQSITKSNVNNASGLKYHFSIFPSYGKKVFPLDIHFNVKWLSRPMILGNGDDTSKKGNLTPLHEYLVELKKAESNNFSRKAADNLIVAQIEKYWLNFEPQKLFPIVKGGDLLHYVPLALVQRFKNMEGYEVYGLLEAEEESYVIGSGIFTDHKELFVLPIDNSSAKLKYQQKNEGLRDLVFTTIFYQKLISLINNKGLANL